MAGKARIRTLRSGLGAGLRIGSGQPVSPPAAAAGTSPAGSAGRPAGFRPAGRRIQQLDQPHVAHRPGPRRRTGRRAAGPPGQPPPVPHRPHGQQGQHHQRDDDPAAPAAATPASTAIRAASRWVTWTGPAAGAKWPRAASPAAGRAAASRPAACSAATASTSPNPVERAVPAGRAAPRRADQRLRHLRRGQPRVGRPDQRRHPGHERRRRAGPAGLQVLPPGRPRRCPPRARTAPPMSSGRRRRPLPGPLTAADRDHPGERGRVGVRREARAGVAAVPRGRHHQHAVRHRVAQGRLHAPVASPVPSDMLITWAPCRAAYRMPSSMALAYRGLEL